MILERTLESQIVAAFKAAYASATYSGAWDVATTGTVKGAEDEDDTAVVAVTVSPRQMADYAGGQTFVEVEIPVEVSVAVRGETDATGGTTVAIFEALAPVVWGWVKQVDSSALTALSISGVFSPGGVQQSGGTAPYLDATARAWIFTISFMVKGIAET